MQAIRKFFRSNLAKETMVILAICALTFTAEHAGLLDRFENAGLDAFNILMAPKDPSNIVLIGIDDADYQKQFSGRSPLDPEKLHDLIDAIARGCPRVIGVDINTSSQDFQKMRIEPGWPPIVWGQDMDSSGGYHQPIPVLGGRPLRENMDRAGIAALPQDSDGVIRRYARYFRTGPESRSKVSSFPWQIRQAARNIRDEPADSDDPEPLRLNFAGERYSFSPLSADNVLRVSKGEGWAGTDGPLRDKIVLLGGTYREARDSYVTPVGTMAGMQLMAQAVESEFGGGIRLPNLLFALLIDILIGFVLVYFHHQFRPSTALILSLLALPVLSIVGSFLSFGTFALWFNFVPVMIGVLIHQLYNHAAKYNRLRREFELQKQLLSKLSS
jgi:CHASE2 domain-containing sensor protein